jgi:N6-L-threonylcarbamoyladenine synthase
MRIIPPDHDADRTLRDGGQENILAENLMHAFSEAEPRETSHGEKRAVKLAFRHLPQTRFHIAADQRDLEIGPQAQGLSTAPERGGAERRSLWQITQTPCRMADKGIAHIGTRQIARFDQAIWQACWQILARMNRQIDRTGKLRLVDFLGEKPLAAAFGKRPVGDRIPCGADDGEWKGFFAFAGELHQGGARHQGLSHRQRRAAATKPQERLRHCLFFPVNSCFPADDEQHRTRYVNTKRPHRRADGTFMLVLGIETTCDETAAAILRRGNDGRGEILANEIASQSEHALYGGVVPEIAARAHIDKLDGLIRAALSRARIGIGDLDAIAAAAGPGLIGGVLVGLTTAKAIALASGKPLIGINHLEAHALTPRLTDNVQFPYLLLLVSGGHTQLVAVLGVGEYRKIGSTIDDAIGEAFDKGAKLLGLGYPGGPALERAAEGGNPLRFDLPRPMLGRPEPNFSLSGLKTALRLAAESAAPLNGTDIKDLAASFQAAIADMIDDRVRVGLKCFREAFGEPTALVVSGGVAANQAIRRVLQRLAAQAGLALAIPRLCAPIMAR